MSKAVELAIHMSADAADVERAFDSAGSAALAMADDVDRAARTSDDASDRFGSVADSADELGSKTSQAAGGLGDLGGALSAMPGPLGAVGSGMEALAPALMGVTGAADLLNLVTQSNIVLTARAKAAAIASAVAQRAAGAAAKVAAAGQWALNVALSANPIGVVIVAVLALVAAVVIAYKRSETFRAICQGVFKAVAGYVRAVVAVVTTLVEFVRDKAPAAWEKLKGAAVSAADYIADKVGGAFDRLMAPIRAVIDLVQEVIDKIGDIDLPDVKMPDLNPFGKGGVDLNPFSRSSSMSAASSAAAPATIDARVSVTVDGSGIVDEAAVARTLEPVLARHAMRVGALATSPTVAPAW